VTLFVVGRLQDVGPIAVGPMIASCKRQVKFQLKWEWVYTQCVV